MSSQNAHELHGTIQHNTITQYNPIEHGTTQYIN